MSEETHSYIAECIKNPSAASRCKLLNGKNTLFTDSSDIDVYSLAYNNNSFPKPGIIYNLANSQPDKLKALIKNNAFNINAKDNCGLTALHYAIILNDSASMKVLIINGANLYTTDNTGRNALHYALYNGNKHIETSLIEYAHHLATSEITGLFSGKKKLQAAEEAEYTLRHHQDQNGQTPEEFASEPPSDSLTPISNTAW